MTREELQKLYKTKVLPESKNPYHFEKPSHENHLSVEAYNPICGDKFKLFFAPDLDGTPEHVSFHGIGCAISTASTSILLRKIEGKNRQEIAEFCKSFLKTIEENDNFDEIRDEDLKILAELKNFEGRMDCVKLSWKSLLDELKKS